MYASTSSVTTRSKQPYWTRVVAGLLHICNDYNNNQEHCPSFQMRCWEKSRYQTNDYRVQQKLLFQVEHLQHAKWEQNQIHLSPIPPPSRPWRFGPYSGHGLPNCLTPNLFCDTDFQFRIRSRDIASFCTLSFHPLRGLPTGLFLPKLPSSSDTIVFHPYSVISPAFKYLWL